MSEEDLRIQQIKMKIKGLTFEQARDISDLCSEYYTEGLKQSRFDKRMLEEENQRLKEEKEKTDHMVKSLIRDMTDYEKQRDLYKSVIEEVREYGKNCLRNMKRDTNEFSILAKQIHINYLQILDKAKDIK